jgi:membrane-bound lytic murein transglycosylase D
MSPHVAFAEKGFFQRLFGGSSTPVQEADKGSQKRSLAVLPEEDMNAGTEAVVEDDENISQDMMERALSFLDESQARWKKGDVEGAVKFLDQAYELVLNTNGDTVIAREKDDLRLLISKRILAVYSSMQTKTDGKYSEIPLVMNDDVAREIRLFQTREREFFLASYRRSGLFRPMIVAELKKAGLPEELSWLPLVESGFKSTALSHARALGLWQFIPSTGYQYGLNRDEWIDERMDSEKATRGAISYMRDLHQMFGDWLTVLAAYNCGEGRVLKVISGQHINYLDHFWDLYRRLPNETARYVPRFLATIHIVRDPQKYGMTLKTNPPSEALYPYGVVRTNRSISLADIAARLQISEDVLNILNAELRLKATPDREYDLKVPLGDEGVLAAVLDEIPTWEPSPAEDPRRIRYARHKVAKGQTFASIARMYGTSVGAIRDVNRLSHKAAIKRGQVLLIPVSPGKANSSPAVKTAQGNAKAAAGGKKPKQYLVKKGDTLFSISQRFGISVDELKRINKLSGSTLKAGVTIRVDKP